MDERLAQLEATVQQIVGALRAEQRNTAQVQAAFQAKRQRVAALEEELRNRRGGGNRDPLAVRRGIEKVPTFGGKPEDGPKRSRVRSQKKPFEKKVLVMMLKDSALALMRNYATQPKNNGANAWRKLVSYYAGAAAQRAQGLASRVYSPQRCKNYKELVSAVESWEHVVHQFERAEKQTLGDQSLIHGIRQLVPEDLARNLHYVSEGPTPMEIGQMADAESVPIEQGGVVPKDADALALHFLKATCKGKGSGKEGKFNGACRFCTQHPPLCMLESTCKALYEPPKSAIQGIFNAPVDMPPLRYMFYWQERAESTEIKAVAPPSMAPGVPMRPSAGSKPRATLCLSIRNENSESGRTTTAGVD
eukprot:4895908-Amphidinium_carterae.1